MQPQENPVRVLLGLQDSSTQGFLLKNLYCSACITGCTFIYGDEEMLLQVETPNFAISTVGKRCHYTIQVEAPKFTIFTVTRRCLNKSKHQSLPYLRWQRDVITSCSTKVYHIYGGKEMSLRVKTPKLTIFTLAKRWHYE